MTHSVKSALAFDLDCAGPAVTRVYVNTQMVQSVLRKPDVVARVSSEDYRGPSPLIYLHINPYVRFEVDLEQRIDFEPMAA
jgi:hypothetical protein